MVDPVSFMREDARNGQELCLCSWASINGLFVNCNPT
jgi:hypothetical protein